MEQAEYKKMDELEKFHWWYRGRRYIITLLFHQYGGVFQKTISLLDIGCGSGEASYIVGNPARLTGVDTNSEALTLAKAKGYRSLLQGQGDNLALSNSSFQGVLALDVLEHIENDRGMLQECFRVLTPGGALFLTVPAYQWLWSGHDEVFGHKRRYAKKDLISKISATGFEIVLSSHYVSFLFPLVAVFRLLERKLAHKHASHFFAIPFLLNKILFFILIVEGILLKLGVRFPFGSSIVVVARKPSVK